MNRHTRRCGLAVVAGVSLGIAGCAFLDGGGASPEERRQQVAAIDSTIADLDDAIARAEAVIADPNTNPEQRANAEKTVRDAEAARLRLAQLRDVTAAATNPDGSIDAGKAIGAAAPFLPPPFNVIALVGAGLAPGLLAFLKARREQRDKLSIIEAINAAKATDPDFAARLKANKGTILEHVTDTAFQAIEQSKATKGGA